MQDDSRFLLLFGSVTGKAESIAELIAEEAEKRGLNPELQCLDGYGKKYDLSKEKTIVIVSSTTGDGDQPENAEPFWRKIKKKDLPADHFSHLEFAILGLGDSNYSQFCNGPKTLNERLLDLGAKSFYEPGWADDGVGLELTVEPWIENLWPSLSKRLGAQITEPLEKMILKIPKTEKDLEKEEAKNSAQNPPNSAKIPPNPAKIPSDKFNCDIDDLLQKLNSLKVKEEKIDESPLKRLMQKLKENGFNQNEQKIPSAPASFLSVEFLETKIPYSGSCVRTFAKFPLADSDIQQLTVKNVRKLSKGDGVKRTYLVTLSDLNVDTDPGDAISLICPNNPKEVEALISRLGLDEVCKNEIALSLNQKTNSTKRNAKIPDFIPKEKNCCTLKEILTWHLDIRSVPKKPFLRKLADFAQDIDEQNLLLYLCTKEGGSDYLSLIRAPNLGILDLLLTLPSISCLDISVLFEHIPRLQPRPYSVASSNPQSDLNCSTSEIDFIFNVAEFTRENGRMFPRKGVCTGWMEDWISNEKYPEKVLAFSRSNKTFRHPQDLSQNLIMIGPGTGVAPFRGFLQKRRQMLLEKYGDQKVGQSWLFFGCRHKDKDFIFREDFFQFELTGVLTRFFACFSRDENETKNKLKYVQDSIKFHKEEFVKLLVQENTIVYICGDAKNMAKDVNSSITNCISDVLDISLDQAKDKVSELIINRRYLEDIWT